MNKDTVLIITNSDEASVPSVVENLEKFGQPYVRFDIDRISQDNYTVSLSLEGTALRGVIETSAGVIELQRIKSVWFRKPKNIFIRSREGSAEQEFAGTEIAASLWSLYTTMNNVYWMNHPLCSRFLLEGNKLHQLQIAKSVGLQTPKTLVSNNPEIVCSFCEEQGGQVAIKALKPSIIRTSDGKALWMYTKRVSLGYLKEHSDEIAAAPVMVEEYVPKNLELRITIVGRHIWTCAIHSQDIDNITILPYRMLIVRLLTY